MTSFCFDSVTSAGVSLDFSLEALILGLDSACEPVLEGFFDASAFISDSGGGSDGWRGVRPAGASGREPFIVFPCAVLSLACCGGGRDGGRGSASIESSCPATLRALLVGLGRGLPRGAGTAFGGGGGASTSPAPPSRSSAAKPGRALRNNC